MRTEVFEHKDETLTVYAFDDVGLPTFEASFTLASLASEAIASLAEAPSSRPQGPYSVAWRRALRAVYDSEDGHLLFDSEASLASCEPRFTCGEDFLRAIR